jgi:hypothetical protein
MAWLCSRLLMWSLNNRGTEEGRTRAGLVLLLACSEAFNRGAVGIIAQRIA